MKEGFVYRTGSPNSPWGPASFILNKYQHSCHPCPLDKAAETWSWLTQSCAEVNNLWSYNSVTPYAFWASSWLTFTWQSKFLLGLGASKVFFFLTQDWAKPQWQRSLHSNNVGMLQTGEWGIRILVQARDSPLLQTIHTDTGAHPASYLMGGVRGYLLSHS
jgi:hypothetical protein